LTGYGLDVNGRECEVSRATVYGLDMTSRDKGSPRPARNIRSDRETFAANFVVDWNVHGDKWQSPHWRENSRRRLRNCSD
jgi:hypothetical protein